MVFWTFTKKMCVALFLYLLFGVSCLYFFLGWAASSIASAIIGTVVLIPVGMLYLLGLAFILFLIGESK